MRLHNEKAIFYARAHALRTLKVQGQPHRDFSPKRAQHWLNRGYGVYLDITLGSCQANRRRYLRALRSPHRYQQGRPEYPGTFDPMACDALDVAQDLATPHGYSFWTYDPVLLSAWLWVSDLTLEQIIDWNYDGGLTFDQIADILESQWTA